MCVNEIWCSHFDEQVHLDKEEKVDTSPEHLPDFPVEISPMYGCKNLKESYGEICVKCNKCGRFGRS